MIFAKFATSIITDPKIIAAGPDGFTLWAKGIIWSVEQISDGFLPKEMLAIIGHGLKNPKKTAAHLVAVGLWKEVPGGYSVGSDKWAKYQTTSATIEAKRESGRARQQRFRNAHNAQNNAQGNGESNALRNGVTDALVTAKSQQPELQNLRNNHHPNPPPLAGNASRAAESWDMQPAIDELHARYRALLIEKRRSPNPGTEKGKVKACLMACGTKSPQEHFELVKAGVDRIEALVKSGYDRQFIPGFDKFFDPHDDDAKGWRGPWEPEGNVSGNAKQTQRVGLYDPNGEQFFVLETEVEDLLAEGWTREPKKAGNAW